MFKTIAIVLLTLALGGAGYFGFTQRSAYGNASKEIAELSDKLKEAEQKEEEVADELKTAEEALEAIPPLEAKAKELEAVKGALASGAVLKDLETLYAKDKKLSTEKQLGLAGIRMLTNGSKDPSTVEAFNKALEMTDWKSQQKVICAAQKALATSGEKVKIMSECASDAPADKGGKDAKEDAHGKKDDGHGAKKDAHGKDAKGAKTEEKHVAHWDYEGEMGPENWGKEFPTCGKGKSQSPLNIKGPFEKVRYTVVPDYKPGPLKILNNGHTIQVNVAPGSKLRIDGKAFDLLQFHFHRPSEEHINGKPSAMVIHFVHKNESGELAVLGVLLQEGNENPGIKTLWAYAPPKEGPEVAPENVAFNPKNLLPVEMEFFHYDGSLTTPPCTEKVKFYILKSQVNISKEQVTQFPFKMNARPVQPLNERKIFTN
jgi:carbonic anhydrase